MSWEIREGDCVEVMASLEPGSVDAVVCDPPYGLEFMGKDWDRLSDDGVAQSWDTRGRTMTGAPVRDPSSPGGRSGAVVHRKDNPRCDNCGRAINGRATAKGFKVCECEAPAPRLPSVSARKMQAWHEAWGREAFRVLKPGGHLLAFGGTRTYHRLACALEDAGFEIRDCLAWLYGSGFPKSLDVSKAIDRQNGAEREVVGRYTPPEGAEWNLAQADDAEAEAAPGTFTASGRRTLDITAPATDDARRWEGWGTALKPAHEPIVLARKPLVGTVAGNVLEHGTGGLNVDATRIVTNGGGGNGLGSHFDRLGDTEPLVQHGSDASGSVGRWPANVILDEQAAALLDEQTGELTSGVRAAGTYTSGGQNCYGAYDSNERAALPGSSGGASRFFATFGGCRFQYTPKASRAERNAGLEGFEESMPHDHASHKHADGRAWDIPGSHATKRANHHPTVKPVSLMRWLLRLVTPPGGLVLDPFAGSGTTGVAAVLEGLRFVGVEREPEYVQLARARIGWWEEHGEDALRIVAERERAEAEREQVAASGQLGLLDGVA